MGSDGAFADALPSCLVNQANLQGRRVTVSLEICLGTPSERREVWTWLGPPAQRGAAGAPVVPHPQWTQLVIWSRGTTPGWKAQGKKHTGHLGAMTFQRPALGTTA